MAFVVLAIHLDSEENCSPLCRLNRKRFIEAGGTLINQFDNLPKGISLLIDGLFGTGFKGQVREPYASLIQAANQSGIPIIAVDIPSGLNGSTGETNGSVIQAAETAYLELPKQGFFFLDGWNAVGKLCQVHFELPSDLVQQVSSHLYLLTDSWASHLLPPIKRSRHKYQAGYVIGLAGSPALSRSCPSFLFSSFARGKRHGQASLSGRNGS